MSIALNVICKSRILSEEILRDLPLNVRLIIFVPLRSLILSGQKMYEINPMTLVVRF